MSVKPEELTVNLALPIGKKPEFHIEDRSSADWYLKVMGGYEDEIQRITEQSNAMIAEIKSKMNGLAYRYKNEFEHFMAQEIASLPKGKNIKFFHGTVQMRTIPQSVSLVDKEAAIQFAETDETFQAYRLVSTVKVLHSTDFIVLAKERMLRDGEVVPGMELKPERQSLTYPGKIEVPQDFQEEKDENEEKD